MVLSPQTPIHVRYATPADNRLLAWLGAETFSDAFGPDNTPENMALYLQASFSPEIQADELADAATCFLIAEVDGQPAGYARLREGQPGQALPEARPIEIVRFYARLAWIGHGVGATLMRACLREAQKRNCDTIWLDVWEKNQRARAFYMKWGFQEAGTQPFRLGEDIQTDLIMVRAVPREP
jgi:GNAT superfamily N-acetyltransferase